MKSLQTTKSFIPNGITESLRQTRDSGRRTGSEPGGNSPPPFTPRSAANDLGFIRIVTTLPFTLYLHCKERLTSKQQIRCYLTTTKTHHFVVRDLFRCCVFQCESNGR